MPLEGSWVGLEGTCANRKPGIMFSLVSANNSHYILTDEDVDRAGPEATLIVLIDV